MRIGIDVGETNTDAVLIDGSAVLAETKAATTEDVTSGISAALAALQASAVHDPGGVHGLMIGTTHFINAIVQGRDLAPTAAIRLGLPATEALPPMSGWPARLVTAIKGRSYLCHGGHEIDGRSIAPPNDRSTAHARSSSASACGRRSHPTRREQPASKNSAVIFPCALPVPRRDGWWDKPLHDHFRGRGRAQLSGGP